MQLEVMQLDSYYDLVDSLAKSIAAKVQNNTITGPDLSAVDDAMKVLEQEAEERSLVAKDFRERMDNEYLWLRIRHHRETLGLPAVECLPLLVDEAVKH